MLNFNISKFLVFPVFPNTVGVTLIEEDLSSLNQIKDLKFEPVNVTTGINCFISENRRLFLNRQTEKDIVMSYFNEFKNSS